VTADTALIAVTTLVSSTACAPAPTSSSWHVLWVRSHCEQLVHDQLAAKNFRLFLPTIDVWSRRGGVRGA
jgi:hypothetical protein